MLPSSMEKQKIVIIFNSFPVLPVLHCDVIKVKIFNVIPLFQILGRYIPKFYFY